MRFHTSLRWLLSVAVGLSAGTPFSAAIAEPAFQVSVDFPPPPSGQGGPSRTAGGGVRGELCFPLERGVTPSVVLAPANNVVTTLAENPTFYAYVPKNTAEAIELIISDNDFSPLFEKQIEISAELQAAMASGPVLLEVVAENAELEADVTYNWDLSMICDLSDVTGGYIEQLVGVVQRLELPETLQTELTDATSTLGQAEAYAEAGVWSETVDLTLSLRDEQPEQWQQLIRSTFNPSEHKDLATVNVEDLFDAPLQVLTIELETVTPESF